MLKGCFNCKKRSEKIKTNENENKIKSFNLDHRWKVRTLGLESKAKDV